MAYAIKSGSMKSRQNTREAIANRKPFQTGGALTGIESWSPIGRLQGDALDQYRMAREGVDYTVLSYGTPIAWHGRLGWEVVEDKFSVTTSTHQSVVRQALHGIDYVKVGG